MVFFCDDAEFGEFRFFFVFSTDILYAAVVLVLTLFSIYIDRSGMETAHGSMVCCLSTNVAMMTNTLAMCPFYAQLGRLQMYRI